VDSAGNRRDETPAGADGSVDNGAAHPANVRG
jgi:hypothetical protein